MYARYITFTLTAGGREAGDELVKLFDPIYQTLNGFKGATFIGDEATMEFGSFSLWETKEDAEAASAALAPKLQAAVAGKLKEPPHSKLFEVLHA